MAKSPMLKVYAKRIPTMDVALLPSALKGKMDTQYFKDPEGTEPIGRIPWYQSGHPTKRTKTVMLNCYRYALEWLGDSPKAVS